MIEVEKGFLWVASFDIGYRNLCFSIEEYNVDEISHLHKIDKNKQYKEDVLNAEREGSLRDNYVDTDLDKRAKIKALELYRKNNIY